MGPKVPAANSLPVGVQGTLRFRFGFPRRVLYKQKHNTKLLCKRNTTIATKRKRNHKPRPFFYAHARA